MNIKLKVPNSGNNGDVQSSIPSWYICFKDVTKRAPKVSNMLPSSEDLLTAYLDAPPYIPHPIE